MALEDQKRWIIITFVTAHETFKISSLTKITKLNLSMLERNEIW